MRNLSSYSFPPPHDLGYENQDDSADREDNEEQNQDQTNSPQNGYLYNPGGSKRHVKRRKLNFFVSGNNNVSSQFRPGTWTEDDVFVLLEVWGAKYMESGGRSLRKDNWNELVEKVSEMSGVNRTVAECKSQLDMLMNNYKKERAKFESSIGTNWVFFRKINELLNVRILELSLLGCGIDSGEYAFMNPQVCRSNLLDEMRYSLLQSGEEDGEWASLLTESNQSFEVACEKAEEFKKRQRGGELARVVAESIQSFGAMYEKTEENNMKQMMELEKMRQDFQRELEMQKTQNVERALAEIVKIMEMDGKDTDEDDKTDTPVDNHGD